MSRVRAWSIARRGRVAVGFGASVAVGLAALVVTGLATAAPGPSPRPTPATTIAEGRRLAREGKLADAAAKLEEGWSASRDPEALFDLAVCYERLGKNAAAVTAFRTYRDLPLALRLREADDHLKAISGERDVGAPTEPPRRVVVPLGTDGDRCFHDCTGPSSCRPRFGDRWGTQCTTTQFICLRSCPGARIEPGPCATAKLRAGERCRTERGTL